MNLLTLQSLALALASSSSVCVYATDDMPSLRGSVEVSNQSLSFFPLFCIIPNWHFIIIACACNCNLLASNTLRNRHTLDVISALVLIHSSAAVEGTSSAYFHADSVHNLLHGHTELARGSQTCAVLIKSPFVVAMESPTGAMYSTFILFAL